MSYRLRCSLCRSNSCPVPGVYCLPCQTKVSQTHRTCDTCSQEFDIDLNYPPARLFFSCQSCYKKKKEEKKARWLAESEEAEKRRKEYVLRLQQKRLEREQKAREEEEKRLREWEEEIDQLDARPKRDLCKMILELKKRVDELEKRIS